MAATHVTGPLYSANGFVGPINIGGGRSIFVNETTGAAGNPGTSSAPVATLTQALALATANHNDVIYVNGTIHVSATVTWSKDGVNLIGLTAPSDNDRARISQTGSSVFSPLVNVTASGCSFVNIATFHGFADASAQICWAEAGGRNYYQNCQFLGMGNATAAAQAGSRSLTVAGSGENVFQNCTIGLDTVTRATGTNASLEFLSATPRNTFRSCIFQALVSNAADVHVTVGSGGMDRYALFDNCSFINAVESTGTTMTAAITANASAGGAILLQGGLSLGATNIATTGPVYVNGASPTADTSSIAIKAT